MESFFRKYDWAINLVLIAAAALLSALLINNFVAARLAELTVPKMPSFSVDEQGATVAPVDEMDREGWVDALARRCLFGCPEMVDPDICPDGCPEGEVCEFGQCVPDEPDEPERADVPQLSELGVELRGVMVASNPRWSMAMLSRQDASEVHVVGVGDIVDFDEVVEILEIRRDRVFIDNGGQLEFIRLEDSPYGDPEGSRQASGQDPRQQRQATNRRQRAQRQTSSSSSDDEERSGVEERGDNQFTVDRQRIEQALADQEQLSREARIMPNYRDGEPDGLRLVGVRPDSFYSELGIRSGDVIHSVNGKALTNQRQALEMLEAMRDNKQVTIEVERRGRREEMEYDIR